MYIHYFVIISPWKRALHLNKLEFPFTQRCFVLMVWLMLAQWFWRRRFFNFINVFSLYHNYLPLEKGRALHLNKLSPSPRDTLCNVRLKLFYRRRFFNFVNVHVYSLFRNYLPLEKGRALHLNKLEFPSPKDALCHVWLKLAQWFWMRRCVPNLLEIDSVVLNRIFKSC